MSAWRREALARLPSLETEITRAEAPTALWIELLDAFRDAADRDTAIAHAILDYAGWSTLHSSNEAATAVMFVFWEHVVRERKCWTTLERMPPEVFAAIRVGLARMIGEGDVSEFAQHYAKRR